MSISENESLATLEFLVAIARADGTIDPAERAALESAFAGAVLPAGTSLAQLLEAQASAGDILARVSSPEARERAFEAAFALAKADGTCSASEQALLDQARAAWSISAEKVSLLDRLVSEARDTVLPSSIQAIADPTQRAAAISEDVKKYAVMTAVLGAFPLPGLSIITDLAVVGMQVKLVRDIGQYYGHTIDQKAARSLIASVGVAVGARMALSNFAKLVPGLGSAVGAATAFAATWAIGRLGIAFFENDGKLDVDLLKKAYESGQKEGKDAYKANKEAIDSHAAAKKDELASLATARKEGTLSEEEYQAKVARLL